LYDRAKKEFEEHLEKYPRDNNIHLKHKQATEYRALEVKARRDWFEVLQRMLTKPGPLNPQEMKLMQQAVINFRAAVARWDDLVRERWPLKYTPEGKLIPEVDRQELYQQMNEMRKRIYDIVSVADEPEKGVNITMLAGPLDKIIERVD
jgi:hypothetical protein